MNRKLLPVFLVLLGLMLLAGSFAAASPVESVLNSVDTSDINYSSYNTVITVTSGLDSPSASGTLRQAVVNARSASKPVKIEFDIPTTCPSYNAALKVWKIEFERLAPGGAGNTLRQLNREITIDGSTQPGGRNDGPKIILYGHSLTGSEKGLTLGENQTQNGNVLRGLAFQNFSDSVTISSRENLIEDCWFGLNDEGTEPLFRANNPQQGSGYNGVAFSTVALDNGNNVVRDNVFLGFFGTAATIRGRDNVFTGNYVGTAADGTVTNPGCTEDHWLGGGGVTIQGRRHLVENNLIAGLRWDQFIESQPPNALTVTADDFSNAGHTIRNNTIGLDMNDEEVGSCGRGITLNNNMRNTLIENNTIVNTAQAGIFLNGGMYNQCELRSNIIRGTTIEYGDGLPEDFAEYLPAKVTSIDGTSVSGTSGDGSPGPNNKIELFLDNTAFPEEALESLAIVTADTDGNWQATLSAPLAAGEGIRTTSTTAQFGTIPGISANTTTKLSEVLYKSVEAVEPPGIDGRLSGIDRYETAIAIAQDSYPNPKSADAVVVARADNFADALPGGVLAYKENGPLLITMSGGLHSKVEAEISRVLKDDGTVYILGGTAAISNAAENQIKNMANYTVIRLQGANRTETAYKIAQEVGDDSGKAILAYSHNFPDALAISSYAAREGVPILTSGTATLSTDAESYLSDYNVNEVYVVGGTGVISSTTFSQVESLVGAGNVKRLGGAGRYDTARLIAQEFFPEPETAALAFGFNFPDALAGGVNAARYNAPVLLVNKDNIPSEIEEYLTDKKNSLNTIMVYGGSAVVSDSVIIDARDLIK